MGISRSYSLFGNCSHSIRNGTSNLHHSLHGSLTLPSVQYQLTLPEVVRTKCFSSNISNSEEKIIKRFSLIKKEQPHQKKKKKKKKTPPKKKKKKKKKKS